MYALVPVGLRKLSYLGKRSEPRENARARGRETRETRETRPNRRACSQAMRKTWSIAATHVEARAQRSSLLVFNIVERKCVLTLHIQLNDRSGVAVDTGIVKIIVRIQFPQKILLSPCLTGLQSGTPLEVPQFLPSYCKLGIFSSCFVTMRRVTTRASILFPGYSLTPPLSFASGTSGRTLGTS